MMRPDGRGVALLTLALALASQGSVAQMIDLLTLPGTPRLKPAADPTHFTFIVAGETNPPSAGAPPTATLSRIVGRIQASKAGFAIFLGDTIYGESVDRKVLAQEYGDFLKVVDQAHVTAYNAPGRRELVDPTGVSDPHASLWYGQLMGLPFGAFSYGNSRFIVLNTEEALASAKSGAKTGLSEIQLAALKKELEADRDRAHVFVFMHQPLKAKHPADALEAGSAEALMALFKPFHNISFVLAADEPLFYNPQDATNVKSVPSRTDPSGQPPTLLVTGGGGAASSEPPDQGGFHHCLEFHVNGNQVDVTIVRLDS